MGARGKWERVLIAYLYFYVAAVEKLKANFRMKCNFE
jgi:hypothetical protein